MKRSIYAIAASMALATAAGAAQFSLEGRWLSDGDIIRNMSTTCEVRFYADADASSPVATQTNVRLKTDSDGFFVLSCESPEKLPDVFWAGIKPSGKAEISPRTKVSPVPFTLSAVEAELVEDENRMELTGTATILELDATGNVTTEEVSLPMGSRLGISNYSVPNAFVDTVTLGDCCPLSFFNAGGSSVKLTPDYLSATDDYTIHAKVYTERGGTMNLMCNYFDGVANMQFIAKKDGFVVLNVKSMAQMCPPCSLKLATSEAVLVDNLKFKDEERMITVPCRKGETFHLDLLAEKGISSTPLVAIPEYLATIDVKVKFVYFGM